MQSRGPPSCQPLADSDPYTPDIHGYGTSGGDVRDFQCEADCRLQVQNQILWRWTCRNDEEEVVLGACAVAGQEAVEVGAGKLLNEAAVQIEVTSRSSRKEPD